MPDILHVSGPYETTYQREFVQRAHPSIIASRPKTSNCYGEPETVPQRPLVSDYQAEYYAKDQSPASPIRVGSSSGNRANKPHPPKSFMMWKFPSKAYPTSSPWSDELTNEKLNQVNKRLCRSTYQTDFLGIPQGFQVRSAYGNLPSDWKENVPYTFDSTQRENYRMPQQQPEHLLPQNRYGCNKKKHLAVNGVIPTANTRLLDIRTRTTYDRHYNDQAPEVAQRARDPTRLTMADANRMQNERPFLPETKPRDTVSRLLEEMEREGGDHACPAPLPPSAPYRPPGSANQHSARARPRVPSATPITNYGYVYDAFQHKLDNGPSPAPSHISAPYSPPLFLG